MLERLDLYAVVRAVLFGILLSIYNFFSILERYNRNMCTFFTLVGEMGMAMHEMHEVTELSEGDYPYEELVETSGN